MNKQIRTRGFSIALYKKLQKEHPEIAQKLKPEEVFEILEASFRLVGELLKDGYRVILEGYFSFFTKPIKRKCTNLHTKETWWTYKKRVRTTTLGKLKEEAEVDITVKEYEEYVDKKNTDESHEKVGS